MDKLVTIPNQKSLAREKELVLIPRREYETLLLMKSRVIPEVALTAGEKRAIAASEKELRRGSYVTLPELRHELASARAHARR